MPSPSGPDAAAGGGFRLADALALRGWALRTLAGEAAGAPPPSSAATWEVFLRAERCAHPLAQALARSGAAPPPGPARVLRRFAIGELQRLMSAAAQLRTLGGIVAERGWRVVVLKGGVLALEPRLAVDVSDLDVLLAPPHARALARLLERDWGYVASRGDPEPREGSPHLAPRLAEHSIQIEIHERLRRLGAAEALQDAAVPLATAPGLFRLAPGDHLRHLVLHALADHPERRGSIRELLLLVQAVRACPPGTVPAACAGAVPAAGAALLEMAGALARGAAPRDEFGAAAASRYLVVRWFGGSPRVARLFPQLGAVLVTLVSDRREYARLWGDAVRRPPVAALSARSAAAARAVRVATPPLRAARLLASSLAVAALVPVARSAASPRRYGPASWPRAAPLPPGGPEP